MGLGNKNRLSTGHGPGLLVVAAALLVEGCTTAAGPNNCRVRVSLQATARVNPDRDGNSLPTPVRFYQLKNIETLKEASFEDLWIRAEEALGDALVVAQEVVVYPGQKHLETLSIQEDTVYMAAAAIFRKPEGITWRTYTRLPPWGTTERCAEDQPGGPYFFLLSDYLLRGSNKPLDPKTPPKRSRATRIRRQARNNGNQVNQHHRPSGRPHGDS